MKFLDKNEEELIDRKSMECLETIGVKVKSENVLKMLDKAGAKVD